MSDSATRKYEIATGLVILGLSFGMVLFGEAGLRAMHIIKFGQADSVEASSAFYIEEETGLRLNYPDRTLGMVRINNAGYRGPDIALPKPENTVRLAFLGSSSTYDADVAEGKNWPHLVAALVAKRAAGCTIDFVNAGKPGYSLSNMAKLYSHHVVQTEPDIVFILAGDVNKDLDKMAEKQGFDTDHTSYQTFLSRYSILFEKVEKNVRIIQLQRSADTREGKLQIDFDNLGNEFREHLIALVKTIKSNGQEPILVTVSTQLRENQSMEEKLVAGNTMLYFMPYIYLPDLVDVREKYNSIIRDVGENLDVLVIGDELAIPGTSEYFVDSGHFSAAGSRMMAERVIGQLSASRLAPAALADQHCRQNARQILSTGADTELLGR